MTTDITVRGQARDVRDPDRAVLHLRAYAEARDWGAAHAAVSAAIATLNASVDALKAAHPGALERLSIGQAYQGNWTRDGAQLFTETVRVTARFTDFAAMSAWAFANTNADVRLQYVEWELSPALADAIRQQLGQAAIKDARDRATTFAGAAGLKIIAVQALADPGLLPGLTPAANGSGPVPRMRGASLMAVGGAAPANEQVIDLTPEPIETLAAVEAHFLAE